MKKLIIAATIVCAAAIANAATMNWGISRTVMDAGSTIASGNAVYFFLNSGDTTQAKIMALYADGGDVSAVAADDAVLASGKVSGSSFTDGAPAEAASAFYVVMSDDRMFMSTAATSTYDALTSTGQWTSPSDTVASMSIKGDAKDGFSGAGWYNAPGAVTPEPTSGMLVLLGLAGLALRRKRA